MNKNTIIIIAVLVIVAVAFVFLQGKMPGTTPAGGKYDEFAKCLTEKGATFYGAKWCGHCNNQKEMFGESFKHVNYIECSDEDGGQSDACEFAGITAYPTWDIAGERVQGAQKFETLSEKTGCVLE
ncbi:hypothetical protein KY319_04975 [Candidatus Woesearchaeota archaeon]|nr:hypothetical protein [Candidatus Woesearchaeota archaeon]